MAAKVKNEMVDYRKGCATIANEIEFDKIGSIELLVRNYIESDIIPKVRKFKSIRIPLYEIESQIPRNCVQQMMHLAREYGLCSKFVIGEKCAYMFWLETK